MGIIRFLLALTVVIAHSRTIMGFSFVGGQIAVQAFYIISGFYMTLILNEKYIGTNKSFKLFISNRFLRLYPIYWTVLILTVIYSLTIIINSNGHNYAGFSSYVSYFKYMNFSSLLFLIFSNIFLFLQDIVMFLGLDTHTGLFFFSSNFKETSPQVHSFLLIPQAWTVGVEISFYLIAPFLVRRKLKVIIPLILLSLLLRYALSQYGLNKDPWSYRFFPTELVFFLLGIISYHIYNKIRNINLSLITLYSFWSLLLAYTLFYNFVPINQKDILYLMLFFIGLPFVFKLSKQWKFDRYIGELSYPIYISHVLILTILRELKWHLFYEIGQGLSLIVVSILFSILLNELVAKPIEKIRQKRIAS